MYFKWLYSLLSIVCSWVRIDRAPKSSLPTDHPSATRNLISLLTPLSSLFLIISCFQTRDVEPPSSSTSDWVSPTDYQILLNNFQIAINQLNVQNYLRVFNTDVFRFTPASSLADDNQNLWSNWSSLDEQTYLENTIARLRGPSGNTLILQQTDLQDFGDSIQYAGNYTLRFNHNDTTLTDLFKGQLLFIIRRNTFNELEIHRWEDLETVPDSSWSLLKQKFIQ